MATYTDCSGDDYKLLMMDGHVFSIQAGGGLSLDQYGSAWFTDPIGHVSFKITDRKRLKEGGMELEFDASKDVVPFGPFKDPYHLKMDLKDALKREGRDMDLKRELLDAELEGGAASRPRLHEMGPAEAKSEYGDIDSVGEDLPDNFGGA